VFANKQDLPNAMSAAEITDRLRLHHIGRTIPDAAQDTRNMPIISLHIQREPEELVVSFFDLGGGEICEKRHFQVDDNIERLSYSVRNLIGAPEIRFYSSSGGIAPTGSPIARFDTLTARAHHLESIHGSSPKREWYIQASCASTGDGLYEGLDWLSRTLTTTK